MNTTTFWIVLISSNGACVFLGFLLGRLTRATVELEQHVIEQDNDSPPPTRPRRRVTALQVIAAAVALIGVMTVIVGVQVTRNQDRIVGCVAGYSDAAADALEQRAAAQAVVNARIDDFMQAILQAFSSAPADARKLILDTVQAYKDARDEQIKAQRENPLPEAPRDACSELMD